MLQGPPGHDPVAEFYNGLAAEYDSVYADWQASIRRQARALDQIIQARLGRARSVLDCTCGIGTQALGLAGLGYEVVGTDLSPAAIARARAEAERRGLDVQFEVADLRTLSLPNSTGFDVVLSADNSLPHLTSESELKTGVGRMVSHLRQGGLFMASIRDYDQILEEKPTATRPTESGAPGRRRITFQLWNWAEDGTFYDLELYVLREAAHAWTVQVHRSRYRPVARQELSAMLAGVGLESIEWQMPAETGFFQPIVTGRRGGPDPAGRNS